MPRRRSAYAKINAAAKTRTTSKPILEAEPLPRLRDRWPEHRIVVVHRYDYDWDPLCGVDRNCDPAKPDRRTGRRVRCPVCETVASATTRRIGS